jgi:hypothetical protein
MTTHIEEARNTAHDLEDVAATHPAYVQLTLRGILHALLALHEQNEPGQFSPAAQAMAGELRTKAVKKTTTPKEPK